ncbi:MAG: hypothetical protein AAFV53_21915 [Myxococcota bacterium]
MNSQPDEPRRILIRTGLQEAIARSSLSPAMYEGLTDSLLGTQPEVDIWLAKLWAYLYEGGPEPE